MKENILRHRKMVLLALASVALLISSSVRAQGTVSAQLDDVIVGFYATGGQGAANNLEIDLGSVSQFYNAAPGSAFTLPGLALQDLVDTYGASWYGRTDLWWGAVATDGNASDANGKPAKTLWATAPSGAPAWVPGSIFSQGTPESVIAPLYNGGAGSLNGAASTSNSASAAVITASKPGSYSAQDAKTANVSFSYFNPTVDNSANTTAGNEVSVLYELQPGAASATPVGGLVLGQSGLSFQQSIPEPSAGALVALGLGMSGMFCRRRKGV